MSFHAHTPTYTHAHTDTHKHAHTHKQTHTHTYIHSHTLAPGRSGVAQGQTFSTLYACLRTQTHKYTCSLTHASTHIRTHTNTHTHSHTLTYTHIHSPGRSGVAQGQIFSTVYAFPALSKTSSAVAADGAPRV